MSLPFLKVLIQAILLCWELHLACLRVLKLLGQVFANHVEITVVSRTSLLILSFCIIILVAIVFVAVVHFFFLAEVECCRLLVRHGCTQEWRLMLLWSSCRIIVAAHFIVARLITIISVGGVLLVTVVFVLVAIVLSLARGLELIASLLCRVALFIILFVLVAFKEGLRIFSFLVFAFPLRSLLGTI